MRPLWPHQLACLQACRAILGREPGYCTLPTGSGKSEIIRHLALDWVREPGRKVLIAVPNRTLAMQHRAGFYQHNHTKIIPTLALQDFRFAPASNVIISTYQSMPAVDSVVEKLPRRRSQFLLIADECHHCSDNGPIWSLIVSKYTNRIGFSATPWNRNTRMLFLENHIFHYSISQAKKDGIICDWQIEKTDRLNISPARAYQLCFVDRHGLLLGNRKRSCVYWKDDIDDVRKSRNADMIEQFRDGKICALYCNRMLLEGFDCPQIKWIFVEKETNSQILAYQMLGRGLRTYKGQRLILQTTSEVTHNAVIQALDMADKAESEVM